jgi:hypothetical protein
MIATSHATTLSGTYAQRLARGGSFGCHHTTKQRSACGEPFGSDSAMTATSPTSTLPPAHTHTHAHTHTRTHAHTQVGALGALVEIPGEARKIALAEFFEKWKNEPLVILKWLGLQARYARLGCCWHWCHRCLSSVCLWSVQPVLPLSSVCACVPGSCSSVC